MELDVLPRRHVTEAARVALRDEGEGAKLRTVEDPLGDLDPKHLRVPGLPLSVGAAGESKGAPGVGGDLAALVPFESEHELIDLGRACE
jgi:hypothetical protein